MVGNSGHQLHHFLLLFVLHVLQQFQGGVAQHMMLLFLLILGYVQLSQSYDNLESTINKDLLVIESAIDVSFK